MMSFALRLAASGAMALAVCAHRAGAAEILTTDDVGGVISRVVQEAGARGKPATVAVVDRVGAVLGVYQMAGAPRLLPIASNTRGPNAQLNGTMLPTVAEAIAKAVTGAYLSTSHGNAFSTRTASQIVQDHFDPGTRYAPSGPLYGVQFSSLPCSDLVVRVSGADASSLTRGPHRSPLGLAADPGGLPLYKNGELVGGVGVKAEGPYGDDLNIHDVDHNTDELLAVAGTVGLEAPAALRADHITAGGLLLRYTDVGPGDLVADPAAAPAFSTLPRAGLVSVNGYYDAAGGLRAGSFYGSAASGLVQDTTGSINTALPAYLLVDGDGAVRYPAAAGADTGALTRHEAQALLQAAYAIAVQTRAQIRNPAGSGAAVTISLVDSFGDIVGVASTPDAPVFGIDVSLQKARSAAFLSNRQAEAALHASTDSAGFAVGADHAFRGAIFARGFAWSARAIGNISRDTLPDGIDGSPNGPFSLPARLTTPFSDGLQAALITNNLVQHVTSVLDPAQPDTPASCTALPSFGGAGGKPVLANGLQIFPGGFPVYRGNTLIGGIGVSGDGVDQDDLIAFLGLYNAGRELRSGVGHAPLALRSSTISVEGVRPHYANCPYAPFLTSASHNVCTGK